VIAPATIAVAAAAAGAAASLALRPRPLAVLAAASLVLPLVAAPALRGAAILAVAALCGLALGAWRLDVLGADPLAARVGRVVAARVVVEEPWRGAAPYRHGEARVAGPGGGPVLLRATLPIAPPRGAGLAVHGRVSRPRDDVRGFRERDYLARHGIRAVLRARTVAVVGARGGVWHAADLARSRLLGAYAAAGDDDAGRLLGAIVLGADEDLGRSTRDDFTRSGLAHVLAVSGQNVALLVGLLVEAVVLAGGSRRHGVWLALVVVPAYVVVVGPSPSVLRAGVAGVLVALAWLASRPADVWHPFACAALLLIGWNPWTVLDVGAQLSFAAVAALALLAPRLRGWLEGVPFPGRLREPVAASAACTLATAPLVWWHFGRLNVVAAVPSNLLALPAIPPLLAVGGLVALLLPFAPGAAAAVATLGRLPGLYLLWVAHLGAGLDRRASGLVDAVVVRALLEAALAAAAGVAIAAASRPRRSAARGPGRLPRVASGGGEDAGSDDRAPGAEHGVLNR
jgi:competence protein ComEC